MKILRKLPYIIVAMLIFAAGAYFMFNAAISKQASAIFFVRNFAWSTDNIMGYGGALSDLEKGEDAKRQMYEIIRCSREANINASQETIENSEGFMFCQLYAIPGQKIINSSFTSLPDSGAVLAYVDVGVDKRKKIAYAYIRVLGRDGRTMYFPISSSPTDIETAWEQNQSKAKDNDVQ